MLILHCTPSPSLPRWDGHRVLFELTEAGVQVPCAISRAALQSIEAVRCTEAADLLARFARARPLIEHLALDKLHARHPGVCGRLSLWADDMDDLPPGGNSAAGWAEGTRLHAA